MSKVSSHIVKRSGNSYRALRYGQWHTKVRYLGGIEARLSPSLVMVGSVRIIKLRCQGLLDNSKGVHYESGKL